MATVVKDFKIKSGLIVEGTTGTINNYDILTKKQADQDYIVNLIGGTATSLNTPDTVVKRDLSGNFAAGTITADLIGDVDGTVSDISNHNTDSLAEGFTNQYYTSQRAKDAAAELLTGASTSNISITGDGYGLTISAENGVAQSTTDDLTEGFVNLYFTDSRARGAVSAGDGLDYDSNTGVFSADLGNGLQFDVNGQIEIDGNVVATDQNVADAIADHSNSTTGVHGVTGDVVGTTDTQTLENKALGTGTTLSANLDADGYTITGLATPTQGTDAATKQYVDGLSAGLTWKAAVNLLANTNVNINSPVSWPATPGIDGHAEPTEPYRVLLTNQTDDSENGIWVYDPTTPASWTRATDADAYTELEGAAVFVMEGDQYGSTSWVQSNHYMTDFTGQQWDQFSGAGTYIAGNGLTLTGNEFSINTSVTATNTYVDDAVDAHANLTSTHGVSGDIVGTSDQQTLSNKVLGTNVDLGADLDAASNKVINLADPTSAQDAATKAYVDNEISSVTADINNLTTDDVAEGNNLYFTDARAKDSAAALLTTATLTNITITGTGNGGLTITAENGVADSTTDDLVEGTTNKYYTDQRVDDYINASIDTDDISEGSTNLYFTDSRAVSALEAVVPNFTEIDINSVATQVAASTDVAVASQAVAYAWAKADYRSAEFLVKVAYSTHTEVSKVILTMDSTDNIAITEYAIVGTNGSASTISAGISGSDAQLLVTTANNNSTVTVVGTLLA